MLKGHTFNLQTFTSDAFALFIDKFLDGRCGIARGCSLSNANNSVTIGEGYFVIKGRFLQIIANETISNIITDGYYSLVCEIDLSKSNTTEELNQAEIKTVYNSSSYPTLTQQDITDNGTVYQYEFARFKVENGNIANFTDRRTFVDFSTIYEIIENESQELITEIEEALQNVLDGSAYVVNQISETKNFSATGISGKIRRQGKIAILQFNLSGSAAIQTEIPITSPTLKPIESLQQVFVGFVGSTSSSYTGPLVVYINKTTDGAEIEFMRNNNINSWDNIKGTITYMCE